MSNIVGEGFPKEIVNQIKIRQTIYGSINRNEQQLTYLNGRTGWCKLVSSVNVKEPLRGINLFEADLAKTFVLFNGTANEDKNIQRAGVWPGVGNSDNYAYGIGGTTFGLRPMPGIKSVSTKTETRGSLKTSTIQIQANNREQFDIIDVLYMRLGFTLFLEWGNSSYFDNSGNYISSNPFSLADNFLAGTLNYKNAYNIIANERLKSCGNYDAIVGKVVNFSWTFTKDGTYDITVILRSMGDVIESLKSNVLLPDSSITSAKSTTTEPTTTEETTPPAPTSETVIKDFSETHDIGKYFYKIQQEISKLTEGSSGISVYPDKDKVVNFFKQKYADEGGTQYYIRLGHFLEWIKKNIIPYVDNEEVSVLGMDYDAETNIIYLLGRQLSTDPSVCLFNTKFPTTSGNFIQFAKDTEPFVVGIKGSTNLYGKIMNAYFNMTYILTQMDSLKNDEGKVPLYDLLDCLCQGWNRATGNFSKLGITVDTEENSIKIIDEVSLPDRDKWLDKQEKPTELASFDVYGYYYKNNGTTSAGFIKDINFTTTVPPNLATMITIGATSNGYVVGQDSTALSRMNAGLEDRFKKKIELKPNNTVGTASLNESYASALDAFQVFVSDLGSYNGTTTPKWNPAAISNFTSTAVQFYEYDQAKQTLAAAGEKNPAAVALGQQTSSLKPSTSASPNGGFLPFDLQVTMDGLSGMKVYQKYIIDTDYLPSNYPTSLEFLIKGITNTLQNNQWTTVLESIAIPKNPFGSSVSQSPAAAASKDNRGTEPVLTNCGPKVLIGAPTTNNPKSTKRIDAIKKAFNATFKNGQASPSGKCARYTYNHAYNYSKALSNGKLVNGSVQSAGGNANQNGYWSNLARLGYTQTQVGKNISKAELKNFIDANNFNVGDVVVYWGNGNTSLSPVKYGHTQMYTGGYAQAGQNWTSDLYTNYNTGFVYNSSKINCWNLILFRAPNV
jgi:hypothetical protein